METAQASFGCHVRETSHLASGGGVYRTDVQTRTVRCPPVIRGTGTARVVYSSASIATADGRNTPRTKRLSALEVPAYIRMPQQDGLQESHTLPSPPVQIGGVRQTLISDSSAQSTKGAAIIEAASASITTSRRRKGGKRRSCFPDTVTAVRLRPAVGAIVIDNGQRLQRSANSPPFGSITPSGGHCRITSV